MSALAPTPWSNPSRTLFIVSLLWLTVGLSSVASAGQPVDIDGTWKIDYRTTATTEIPVIDDFETTTRAVLVAEINQSGRDLDITTRVCSLELSSDMPLAQPVAPQAFVDSLPAVERRGQMRHIDGEWQIRILPVWETVGVQLDDPEREPLPEDGDDPRVFDQDQDGNPGGTIRIEGVLDAEIYIVQRSWDRWWGKIRNPNLIEGAIQWHTEQSVVGASHRILRNQPRATPHPDQSKNVFRMTRSSGPPPC